MSTLPQESDSGEGWIGVDALITTLRDEIDEELFEAGKNTLKIIAQDAVGFDQHRSGGRQSL